MRMRVALIISLTLVIGSHAEAIPITGPITHDGHDYYLLSLNTWFGAEADAQLLGGHLVTINDAAEDAFVYDTFADYDNIQRLLWIGLNDVTTEGTFVWASGQPVVYTHWNTGEPNNLGNEDFVHIWPASFGTAAGTWNDLPGSSSAYGVAEIEQTVVPEPATLFTMITGLGIGYLTRKRHS